MGIKAKTANDILHIAAMRAYDNGLIDDTEIDMLCRVKCNRSNGRNAYRAKKFLRDKKYKTLNF